MLSANPCVQVPAAQKRHGGDPLIKAKNW